MTTKTPREPDRYDKPPRCMQCFDRGIFASVWTGHDVYCACPAGEGAKETRCLDADDLDPPQPNDFGDQ